jgi:hypothetical protein
LYKLSFGERNSNLSNKGPSPLQRGDNHKNVKMGWCHFKIFSRTTGPILTRLGANNSWGRRFKFKNCSNEGDCPSSRRDNSKSVKIH